MRSLPDVPSLDHAGCAVTAFERELGKSFSVLESAAAQEARASFSSDTISIMLYKYLKILPRERTLT
jgi:hypothetical protein